MSVIESTASGTTTNAVGPAISGMVRAANASTAIVHDWLTIPGGAEKVVAALVECSPRSELFTVFNFLGDKAFEIVGDRSVHVSPLNSLPLVRSYYRYLLLMAMREVERFDLSRFDVVLSSSAAISKGVLTRPGQPHIAYIHSPARYAWDMTHEYLQLHGLNRGLRGMLAREVLHQFRIWDSRTVAGVDTLVANSNFVRRRIWKAYRREAEVVYPPVDIDVFARPRQSGEHFVVATRLVDYKRVDLVVQAFAARQDLKLVVIGEGPELNRLKQLAAPNVELAGYVSREEMLDIYSRARAYVYVGLEDFGIAQVEAQAAGLPVIALEDGGALEIVNGLDGPGNPTGVFARNQSIASVLEAIGQFEVAEHRIQPEDCIRNASRFSKQTFVRRMTEVIDRSLSMDRDDGRTET